VPRLPLLRASAMKFSSEDGSVFLTPPLFCVTISPERRLPFNFICFKPVRSRGPECQTFASLGTTFNIPGYIWDPSQVCDEQTPECVPAGDQPEDTSKNSSLRNSISGNTPDQQLASRARFVTALALSRRHRQSLKQVHVFAHRAAHSPLAELRQRIGKRRRWIADDPV